MSEIPTANPTRELAAIMFSDIAGYTLIMGRDEARAMHALGEHRALLRTLLPRFNGRLLGEIGDGTLTSFHSAVDAVNCAREVQAALKDSPDRAPRMTFMSHRRICASSCWRPTTSGSATGNARDLGGATDSTTVVTRAIKR
jgi:hypothetical protein